MIDAFTCVKNKKNMVMKVEEELEDLQGPWKVP